MKETNHDIPNRKKSLVVTEPCCLLTMTGRPLRNTTLLKRKCLDSAATASDIVRTKKKREKKLESLSKQVHVEPECILVDDKKNGEAQVSAKSLCMGLKNRSFLITNHVHQLPEGFMHQNVKPINYVLTPVFELVIQLPENFSLFPNFISSIPDLPSTCELVRKSWEESDLLLVDVLKPQNLAGFVGNAIVVEKLSCWLQEWERRCQKESIKPVRSKRSPEFDPDFECSSDSNDSSVNAVLLFGPTGVGKTSLVYALAQQMGFTVLELNASLLRSGKIITTKLKEATLSHHVEGTCSSEVEIHSLGRNKTESKVAEREKMPDTKKKSIADFFKKSLPNRTNDVVEKSVQKREPGRKSSLLNYFIPIDTKEQLNNIRTLDEKVPRKVITDCSSTKFTDHEQTDEVRALSFSSNTIILIDDVDIVFEEDEGFWSAVNTFIRTTKKPVILTATHNLREILSCADPDIDLLQMQRPDGATVATFLREACATTGFATEAGVLEELVELCGSDIRRVLLQLQLSSQLPQCNISADLINCVKNAPLWEACVAVENCPLIVYNQFSSLLCLPVGETVSPEKPKPVSTEKKWSLDASWLSDDAREPETERCTTEAVTGPHVNACLRHFAENFETFSMLDSILGHLLDDEKTLRWKGGLPSVLNLCEPTGNFPIDELASWMMVLSSRVVGNHLTPIIADHPDDEKLSWNRSLKKSDDEEIYQRYNEVAYGGVALCHHLNSHAVRLDYWTFLRAICRAEEVRREVNTKRRGRFLHYLNSSGLVIDMTALGEISFSNDR